MFPADRAVDSGLLPPSAGAPGYKGNPTAPLDTQTQNFGAGIPRVAGYLSNHRNDFRGSKVERGNEPLRLSGHAPARTTTWPA